MITPATTFVLLVIFNVDNDISRAYSEITSNQTQCIQRGKKIKSLVNDKKVKVIVECIPSVGITRASNKEQTTHSIKTTTKLKVRKNEK